MGCFHSKTTVAPKKNIDETVPEEEDVPMARDAITPDPVEPK